MFVGKFVVFFVGLPCDLFVPLLEGFGWLVGLVSISRLFHIFLGFLGFETSIPVLQLAGTTKHETIKVGEKEHD